MKFVSVVQHTQSEWLGSIEDHLEGRGIRFAYFRPFTVDGRLPDIATLGDGLILLGGGPWGTATADRRLPTLDAEVRLARACLMLDKPVVGFGVGAQVLSLAAGGGSTATGYAFEIGEVYRSDPDALAGLLPARITAAFCQRDRPLPPAYAGILAVDATGAPAVFQVAPAAFGLTFHPGLRRAMAEELMMEFGEMPAGGTAMLAQLGCAQRAIDDALVPIMAGLVTAARWMEP